MTMVNTYFAKLIFRNNIAPNIYHLRFELINNKNLEHTPGQYLLLKIKDQYRQYSIFNYNKKHNEFDLIIEYFQKGLASEYLIALKNGETSEFKGPAGIFVQKQVVRPIVYLATGTGIAPILEMIRSIISENTKYPLFLFWGLSRFQSVYLKETLDAFCCQNYLFKYAICLSRETVDDPPLYSGYIQDNIDNLLEDLLINQCDVYVCGGKNAVEGLREFAKSMGVGKSRLFFERFN